MALRASEGCAALTTVNATVWIKDALWGVRRVRPRSRDLSAFNWQSLSEASDVSTTRHQQSGARWACAAVDGLHVRHRLA